MVRFVYALFGCRRCEASFAAASLLFYRKVKLA